MNYAVIGLIQIDLSDEKVDDLAVEEVDKLYEAKIREAKTVMLDKNHDYGEAWREMSQESFTDLILMKLLRIRQIISNDADILRVHDVKQAKEAILLLEEYSAK